MNIQTNEHVSYHHMSVAFVRGKWNRKDTGGSSMLMSKCCHDLDLLMWMKSGTAPQKVSSFGNRMYFRPEKAPEGSGNYCLVDCPLEKGCLYSVRKHFLDHPERWSAYVWSGIEHIKNSTLEQKEAYLKDKNNPYARCIWKCDNDVVDHQSVVIQYEDGSTATHNMVGGASRPQRAIHILGSEGEIWGVMDDSRFYVRKIDPRPGKEYSEEEVDLNIQGDMTGAFGGHGGGDSRLVEDFVHVLQGETASISCTSIEDSVNGHLVGFAADRSVEENKIIELSL
jgi:predicted dehydrogenase